MPTPSSPSSGNVSLSLVETYRQGLQDLTTALGTRQVGNRGEAIPKLLTTLLARDRLEAQRQEGGGWDAATFEQVTSLDAELRGLSNQIDAQVNPEMFTQWRDTQQPSNSSWWWFLDQQEGLNPLANAASLAATILLFAVALGFLAEVVRRLFSGGSDALSILNTGLQGALALLLGSAALQLRGWLDQVLQSRHVRRRHWPLWKLGVGLGLLGLAVLLWKSLPSLATPLEQRGRDHLNAEPRRLTRAIFNLEYANLLDPNNVNARYNLAVAYEEASRYEEAISEYLKALTLNAEFYPAYNNLARLYILRKDQPADALEFSTQAFKLVFELGAADQEKEPEKTQAAILKNRAWAFHKLGLHHRAAWDLQYAIIIRPEAAAPRCLLAQVYEELKKSSQAVQSEWDACIDLVQEEPVVEAEWRAMAEERAARQRHEADTDSGDRSEEGR